MSPNISSNRNKDQQQNGSRNRIPRILRHRYSRYVLMGLALITLIPLTWFTFKLFWGKSEESEIDVIKDEEEQDKPKDIIPPEPEEDEEFFEFLDDSFLDENNKNKTIMKLIIPKGTKFKDGTYNNTKWFMGDYDKSGIRGHVNTSPLDSDGDCDKYTRKFLSQVDDPGDGYVKYSHKTGAVACVWEGVDEDMGVYIEEFYIINDNVEYSLVVTNPVDEQGKSTKKIRARGVIDVGDFEHIMFEGFESGDTSEWTKDI